MAENYYDEILEEIEDCLMRNELDRAKRLIENELSMPYVPAELETKLRLLQKEIRAMEKDKPVRILGIEEIEIGLKGNPAEQLKAVDALSQLNLRNYVDLIQSVFDSHPHPNIQALLIETLIDQQLSDEFILDYYGAEIAFIPRYAEKPEETDGYRETLEILNQWFESENPSFLNLCKKMLIQECYLMLPMAYESEEALPLALSIVQFVSALMDENQTFHQLMAKLDLKDCAMLVLKSNNN